MSFITRVPRPIICWKNAPTLGFAHEKQALKRLNVGARGDHIDRHDDARVGRVAKRREQHVGITVGRPVGDLLGEVVAFAELLPRNLDDVFRFCLGIRPL